MEESKIRKSAEETEAVKEKAPQKIDLRKQKTRKALEDAFYELSETKWIEDITVGDICEKAMVRRATFYKHYGDKYEFFASVMNNIQRNTNLLMNGDPRNIPMEEYLVNICRSYIRNFREHPRMVKRITNSNSRQTYSDILVSQTRKAIINKAKYDRSKGLESDINLDVLASFISGAIPNLLTMYNEGRIENVDEETFLEEIRTIFKHICTTHPIEEQK